MSGAAGDPVFECQLCSDRSSDSSHGLSSLLSPSKKAEVLQYSGREAQDAEKVREWLKGLWSLGSTRV